MNRQHSASTRRARGFTIIELMTAITILGVLLGIGVPSFNEMIRNNRTAAQTNSLVTALTTARSEATKRGVPVAVCASNAAQSACQGAAGTVNWQNGYILFTDRMGGAGVVNAVAGDVILQRFPPVPNTVSLTSANTSFVRYAASGLPTGVEAGFTVIHNDCTGENRRVVTVTTTGRLNTARLPCT